ncbi:MAG: hypothetical protein AAGI91_02380 [Bacteroidota bacterium]
MTSAAVAAPPPGRPALLVHGGAWDIPLGETAAHVEGLAEALARGQALLEAGPWAPVARQKHDSPRPLGRRRAPLVSAPGLMVLPPGGNR